MKWAAKNRKASRTESIFSKLLINYIMLTFLIVTLTGLVSYFLVRQQNIDNNLDELQSKAETVADMIAMPGGATRVLTIQRLDELQVLSDARLAYIDVHMNVRQLSPHIWHGSDEELEDFVQIDVKEQLDRQLLQSLLDGEIATDVRKFDFMGDEVVFAGAPVVEDDKVTGAVLLYRPLRQVSATTEQTLLLMMIAAVVALAVAIFLAYFMGRRLSYPLVEMNRAAKHIADGHYGERVAVKTRDEVGQLGHTLNLLSERLETVIRNLSEEKGKLEKVISSIGEGVIAIDRVGNMVHHNPAAMEILGQEGYEHTLMGLLHESMGQKERRTITLTHDKYTIEAVCSPMLDERREAYGAVCLLHDVSEAQRLEQLRRDYIANISHELRTPLTGIRGMVEPLMDGYIETEEELRDCYQVIYQETMRLERLIGEMLDLSRLQDGRIQMELEPMEAVPLLKAACRRLQGRADEGEVRLEVENPTDDMLAVMGNENRIIQVLIILMDNAISFTKPGGFVKLGAKVTEDEKMVEVSVEDSGAGISQEDLPYIWERFFKADRSRMRTQGVGLGLPIAKLIVELMGGSVRVDTKIGVGSVFRFTLRQAPSHA